LLPRIATETVIQDGILGKNWIDEVCSSSQKIVLRRVVFVVSQFKRCVLSLVISLYSTPSSVEDAKTVRFFSYMHAYTRAQFCYEAVSCCRLIGSAGGQNGIIQSAGCFFTLYVVMAQFGFMPRLTTGIRADWDNNAINNLQDSYGQEWVCFVVVSRVF
jgi:hypothetical protein